MLDVQKDFRGRIIYTIPDQGSINIIDGDQILHVATFEVCKYFLS